MRWTFNLFELNNKNISTTSRGSTDLENLEYTSDF